MTKTEFNKTKKYLKSKLPSYIRFKLREDGKPYRSARHDLTGTFVSISVDTLFNIVNELLKKKN